MKSFVWLFILLNIGLFAYFNRDFIAPKNNVTYLPINPEKLMILSQAELDGLAKKETKTPAESSVNSTSDASISTVVAEPVVNNSCYEWGSFTSSNLPSAQVALVKLGLQASSQQTAANPEDRRFWVYYPPLKSSELALAKANEIRALGVSDLYIVQDSQWRNAISFGLFQDEQLAAAQLSDLRAKGVKNANKILRNPGKVITTLIVKNVTDVAKSELEKIAPEFIGSELKQVTCP
jgi:hypothetical protein